MSEANAICPFGAEFQNYWNYLSPFERQMKMDVEGLYSVAPQEIMDPIAAGIAGSLIIDAFCGIGGSTIAFARAGKEVISIDSNEARLDMARANVRLFGVEKQVTFIHGDALKELNHLQGDCIFLDPPWGGPDYSKEKAFTLRSFNPDGSVLFPLALSRSQEVVARLPKNFAVQELSALGVPYTLYESRLGPKLMNLTVHFKTQRLSSIT